MDEFHNTMTSVLTVRDAVEAVAFYQRAFGAEEIYRNTYGDGMIVAELAVGEARFRVADEAPRAGNLSPESLGGTSVRLNLMVADPDGLAARARENGAIEVAPIADQSYGLRQGRIVDPFGHHWLIGRPMAGAIGDWARTPDSVAEGSAEDGLRAADRVDSPLVDSGHEFSDDKAGEFKRSTQRSSPV